MHDSLSLSLHTLKSKSVGAQIQIIDVLSKTHLHLHDEIKVLIRRSIDGTFLRLHISGKSVQLIQLAMLTVVAVDILTVPDRETRTSYYDNLRNTLSHFGLSETDIHLMIPISSQLDAIF